MMIELCPTTSSSQKAFDAGKDCGLNGPNTTNCHFMHFSTRELTEDWERGKAYGEAQRETDAVIAEIFDKPVDDNQGEG